MAKVVVVMLSGKQGSGKSTTAAALKRELGKKGVGVIFDRFAKPLYDAHDAVLAVLRGQGILPNPGVVKDGLLLQVLGNDWARKTDPLIWVRGFQKRVEGYKERFSSNPHMSVAVVCEDCRYINEFESFPDHMVVRVRLEAPEEVRKLRTDQWRENVNHQSEIGLDHYVTLGKFDSVHDSSVETVEDITQATTHLVMGKLGAMLDG